MSNTEIKPTIIWSILSEDMNNISIIDTVEQFSGNTITPTIERTFLADFYYQKMPSNIDVTSKAESKIHQLHNESVRKQVSDLLDIIKNNLMIALDMPIRLPKISLTKLEDDSALIEWNFENFRFGFSLEPEENESYFYVINMDERKKYFKSESYPLGTNREKILSNIICFVVENT